ncbi:MAG: peptidyl-prolyl cis-trans isomerase [Candidatus Omnitrophota bacterium]
MKKYSSVFICIYACAAMWTCALAQDTALSQETHEIAAAAQEDATLATVGDWHISLTEFNQALKKLTPVLAQQKIPMGPDFKEQMLNELVEQEILAQIAARKGKDKDADLVRAMNRYRSALLAAKLMEETGEAIVIDPADVKTFYDANKEIFANPPREIKILEILAGSEPEAQEIAGRLARNEDFATVARKSSKSESAKVGGDLGFISTREILLTYHGIEPPERTGKNAPINVPNRPEAFWEKAIVLAKGEISDPIKVEDGTYYIIKVSDIRGGQTIPELGEVSPYIEQYLKMNRFEKEIEKLVDGFKASQKVEINKDLLK